MIVLTSPRNEKINEVITTMTNIVEYLVKLVASTHYGMRFKYCAHHRIYHQFVTR